MATRWRRRCDRKVFEERRQHLGRIMPAAHAVFVVTDADEPGIFERLEPAERNVRGDRRPSRGPADR